jgi:hypothetical protein
MIFVSRDKRDFETLKQYTAPLSEILFVAKKEAKKIQ